jgi:hypothetical protein
MTYSEMLGAILKAADDRVAEEAAAGMGAAAPAASAAPSA